MLMNCYLYLFLSEEDQFLSAIIPEVNIYDLQFKLMPAYLTYMTARFAYRAQFLSSPSVRNRSGNMTLLCSKVAFRIYRLIQVRSYTLLFDFRAY